MPVFGTLREEDYCVLILSDSSAAINMIKNNNYHDKAKYIRLRGQHVHDYVTKSVIRIQHCSSEDNLADLLTKPMCAVKLKSLRERAGMFHYDKQSELSSYIAFLKENDKLSSEEKVREISFEPADDILHLESDLLLESSVFFRVS